MKEAAEFFLDYLVEDPQRPARQRAVGLAGEPLSAAERQGRDPRRWARPWITRSSAACSRRRSSAARSSASTPRSARRLPAARAAAAPADDRQARPDPGMVGGLRRARARPPPHLAALRPPSGRPDHGARHAGSGARGARDARAPARARRRPHRLEPRLDHQLLGAARRRREGLRELPGAAREVHAAQPVGPAPAVPDRRQLRRHRGRRPRCCCRATPARSTCCPRCRGRGPTARSAACAPGAASRST